MKTSKKQWLSGLRDMLALILCALILSPMFRFFDWEVFAGFGFLWLVIAYFCTPEIFKKIFFRLNLLNAAALLWIIASIILMICGKFIHPLSGMYNVLIIGVIYFGKYYLTLNDKKILKLFFYFFILVIVILCFGTLIANVKHENLSRLYANGDNSVVIKIANPFVGGYAFVYSVTFIIGAYAALIRRADSNILQFAILYLMLAMVLVTQYTMAIIISAFLLIVNLFYTKPQTKFRQQLQLIITGLAVSIILFFGSDICTLIAKSFEGSILQARFNEIAQMLRFDRSINEIGLDMSVRFDLYASSIETFKQNIFLGAGESSSRLIVGGHSTFFDMFASFGLLGGLPFCFFILAIGHDYCTTNKKNAWVFVYSYIMALWLILFNTFANPPMYFTMFVVIPFIIKNISLRKGATDYPVKNFLTDRF